MKHCSLTKAILHLPERETRRGGRNFGNRESFRQRDRQGPTKV